MKLTQMRYFSAVCHLGTVTGRRSGSTSPSRR